LAVDVACEGSPETVSTTGVVTSSTTTVRLGASSA
jgi:hypothetical protein